MSESIILAPLLGVTDSCYRESIANCFGGFDHAIAPFLKTLSGGRYKASKLKDLEPRFNQALPVQPQIISNNPDDFIALAKVLHDFGYESVNLNLGCPVPMAAGRGRGAGLIPHSDLVSDLLDKIIPAIPNSLSIKTRIGYESPDELQRLVEVLNRYPIGELAIHPRTAKDLYSGTVNLEALDAVVKVLKHKIIYSGDINNIGFLNQLRSRYPQIKSWLLGRGGIRNPCLARDIKGMDPIDSYESKLISFYESLREGYLERGLNHFQTLQKLKALWFYQANVDLLDKRIVKKVRKEKDLESFGEYIPFLSTQHQNMQSLAPTNL